MMPQLQKEVNQGIDHVLGIKNETMLNLLKFPPKEPSKTLYPKGKNKIKDLLRPYAGNSSTNNPTQ